MAKKRITRRKNPGRDPISSMISYLGDRLRSGQPVNLPYGPTGLDDFARTEGAFLLRHQAQAMAGKGATPQELAFSFGKSKALAALADFLDAFNVHLEPETPEVQEPRQVKITQNSVDRQPKPPDKSGTGGGPTFDV